MLTPDLVDELLKPISEASPCGEDLEYDPDFMAAEAAAVGKPEQQFGDTVIPAVEPEWNAVAEQALALLRRSKDVRTAVLLMRASIRRQGLAAFGPGMALLQGLLDQHWAHLHPALDAEDDDDPTMRLNGLAALTDETLMLRDLMDASIGTARGVGTIRVRDVVLARGGGTGAAEHALTAAQVQGALEEIFDARPEVADWMCGVSAAATQLQRLITERSGRADAVDFSPLRALGQTLLQAAQAAGAGASNADAAAGEDAPSAEDGNADAAPRGGGMRGEIASRQDALQALDRVIRYLEVAEPGNPAPLLLERAKKLIGVSFLDIIANLAPDAMSTIEQVTGARMASDAD